MLKRGNHRMASNLTKEDMIALLQAKAATLGCFPQKSDFSEYEVSMIKAYFGPWPRALEAAGIKEISQNYLRKKKNHKKKRIESKARKRVYKVTQKNTIEDKDKVR